nr:unnamed protein product [Spirometra erinaceieuropaei]
MLQSEWCAKQVHALNSTRDESTEPSSVRSGGGSGDGGGGDNNNNPPINWNTSDEEVYMAKERAASKSGRIRRTNWEEEV